MKDYTKGYISRRQYFIYIIIHPKFDGWIKLGRTTDLKNRLTSYQTGCPFREYELIYNKYVGKVQDVAEIENYFKTNIHNNGFEWYECTIAEAIETIEKLTSVEK
jgi:hypothetical protein